ncbi:hypothetical protein C7U60_20185 [Mesorhizobium plurifarium]|nr:hypothetical protein C7U60_20185 [Mesorhizobium plurifarium]
MVSKLAFPCPVCGYPHLDEPPYDSTGCPTYNICPCCGTEFGYDDASVSHNVLRSQWINRGMTWWSKHVDPPKDWDPNTQLSDAGLTEKK